MRIMFEDEVLHVCAGLTRRLWVHADFTVRSGEVVIVNMRAYDMNPQSDDDRVDVTPELIDKVCEIVEERLYG